MTVHQIPDTLEPVRIAPDTFVIQGIHGEGEGPMAVHMNSMLIRGAQPMVVDTGAPVDRDNFVRQLTELVDPEDVRWVFISHDDVDHYGNVDVLMQMCPNAVMIASWYLTQRMSAEGPLPPMNRWRWLGDGESMDIGDRTVVALRPPLYDSPTTRGLLDVSTGVYWASDCFSTPVPRRADYVDELDPDLWADGFAAFGKWNSPWIDLLDHAKYHRQVEDLRATGLRTIATCHGPTIGAALVDTAFDMMHGLPAAQVPEQPGQPVLEQMVAALEAHDRLI
jgi:flavorubredoxin